MEAKLWLVHSHSSIHVAAWPKHAIKPKPRTSSQIASMALKPIKKQAIEKREVTTEVAVVVEYRDNWFDRLAIHHLSQSLQATTGIRNKKKGYESLIEVTSMVARNFEPHEQQELVIGSLNKAIPPFILTLIRVTMTPSKFSRECFAYFTTVLFSWLIGPCEVKESEFQGNKENNIVYIKKCRFLEGTNCVGMCTHLCKLPSQKFLKDSFGMPVNMVPNFEDMSCEMIFGEDPPAPADDPALKQPCYKILCKAKQSHNMNCSMK